MIERIASKQGRNDEAKNIELAQELSKTGDIDGIKEIVSGLKDKDKAVANDCIKVLYEIGSRRPELISDYTNNFIFLLHSKNNRLVWGSMTALAEITDIVPEIIYMNFPVIIETYEKGSVITVDNCITVFAKLCKAGDRYEEKILPILINHLRTCRPKEVPQHAERASFCFNASNKVGFIEALTERIKDLNEPGKKRVNRLLRTLNRL